MLTRDLRGDPGGMCRQFIREFCALSAPVIMFDKDDRFVIMRLEQVSITFTC